MVLFFFHHALQYGGVAENTKIVVTVPPLCSHRHPCEDIRILTRALGFS